MHGVIQTKPKVPCVFKPLIHRTTRQHERICRRTTFKMKQQILSFGKDSLIYGVGSVVTRFIGLITLPLFTAYLSPEEYGVLAMLSLLTMVAQPVFNLGVSAAMGPSYFGSDSQLNKSKAVWTAFAIILLSSTILVAIAWLFPVSLGQMVRLPADYSILISLSLTGCALTILVTPFILRMQFEKQAKLYVIATLTTSVVAIVISILTVVTLGWGVRGMVIGQLAGNATTFFAFFLFGLKGTTPSISLTMAKELLRQGLPLIPGFAFLFILMHSNKYILEQQAGLDAVGIYSIGFNFGMAISIVTGGIATAWYPFFMTYQNRQAEARVIFGRIFTYYTIGVGLLTIFFFTFSKPLVMILTNDNFHEAYVVVGLIASVNYFMGMYSLFLPGMYYKSEIGVQSVIQGCAVLFSLPFSYLLIVEFGILGAGLSVSLSHLLVAGFTRCWNIYRRRSYVAIDYEWKRVAVFLFIYIIAAALFLSAHIESLSANLIASCVGSLAVILLIIQLLKPSEIEFMPYLKIFKLKLCAE